MNDSVVIIPTYNEKKNISNLLEEILKLKKDIDIIVVDDNSPDGTAMAVNDFATERQSDAAVHLITRPSKMGLGSAYLEAFEWINSHGSRYENIFMMDADFSHNPAYLPSFIEMLSDGKADIVVGSRYVAGGGVSGWPLTRKIISRLGNLYARGVTGLKIYDLTSGFIGLKRNLLEYILKFPPRAEGYGFLIELKHRAFDGGFSVKEFPIIFTDRTSGKSKISRNIIIEAFFLVWRLRFLSLWNKIKSSARRLLYPLTFIYRILLSTDRFFKIYRRKKHSHSLSSLKIASVGNITWGGTGKTPFVIRMAREISSLSCDSARIAVILRGYRSRGDGKGSVVISSIDGITRTDFYESAGDEAAEIYFALNNYHLKNFVVVTGADRYKSALIAHERFGAEVVIMDDGFQRVDMPRNLDVVCVNAANPFGNGLLIPAGILREPVEALARADALVLTNSDTISAYQLQELRNFLTKKITVGKRIPIYETYTEFCGLVRLEADGTLSREGGLSLNGGVVGFAGLGSNEIFKIFIEKKVAPIENFYSFRDHHWYSPTEMKSLIEKHRGAVLITSRKDIMRIVSLVKQGKIILSPDDKIYAVESEIKFTRKEEEESWQNLLKERLSLTVTAR